MSQPQPTLPPALLAQRLAQALREEMNWSGRDPADDGESLIAAIATIMVHQARLIGAAALQMPQPLPVHAPSPQGTASSDRT